MVPMRFSISLGDHYISKIKFHLHCNPRISQPTQQYTGPWCRYSCLESPIYEPLVRFVLDPEVPCDNLAWLGYRLVFERQAVELL